jgi:CTP:molybdopterin cytidylyltransferase MocA
MINPWQFAPMSCIPLSIINFNSYHDGFETSFLAAVSASTAEQEWVAAITDEFGPQTNAHTHARAQTHARTRCDIAGLCVLRPLEPPQLVSAAADS